MAKRKAPKVQEAESLVYVYVGPSIRGLIQNGTIYSGTKAEIERATERAVMKKPEIKRLIIEADKVADVRNHIQQKKGLVYQAYKKLLIK